MGVRHPMVIVKDHDGGHAARGHHEHDGGEVCPCGEKFVNSSCK